MNGLFQRPFDGSARPIAVGKVVVERGKTVRLAVALDLSQMRWIKERLLNPAPIMG